MSGPAEGGGRPRLAAVPPSSEPPAPTAEPQGARDGSRRWILGLAAALALVLGVLAVEARRAGQLAEQLAETEARLVDTRVRLAAAEDRLAAYEGYLAAVRARAGRLQQELEGLSGLLAADPAEGAPAE